MNTLDPRVIFYLERQKQIDQWYNLRGEVTKAAHEFFATVAAELEDRAAPSAEERQIWQSLDEASSKIMLCRTNWIDATDSTPFVGIGLEWSKGATQFDNSYAGVWVNQAKPGHEPLKSAISSASEEFRQRERLRYSNSWPVWQYEKPQHADYWNHLDAFRNVIVADIEKLWSNCASLVDAALAARSE